MATNLRSPDARFVFRSMGRQGKYRAFRATTYPTINRTILDSQQFEAEVAGFLMDKAQGDWHVGSFKDVAGYAKMPFAFETGNALCVLIESNTDLVSFEQAFEVEV